MIIEGKPIPTSNSELEILSTVPIRLSSIDNIQNYLLKPKSMKSKGSPSHYKLYTDSLMDMAKMKKKENLKISIKDSSYGYTPDSTSLRQSGF